MTEEYDDTYDQLETETKHGKPEILAVKMNMEESEVKKKGPSARCKKPCWWLSAVLLLIIIALLITGSLYLTTDLLRPTTPCRNPMSSVFTNVIYTDCQEAFSRGMTQSGIYKVSPDGGPAIRVLCEQYQYGGGWTVFQQRRDGSTSFYHNWATYKKGFGNLTTTGQFWIGNDNLHRLTKSSDQMLKIELKHPNGLIGDVNYSNFSIGAESENYKLLFTSFDGNTPPGDSLAYHNGRMFSTYDADHDENGDNCALLSLGAWWYNSCVHSNLNGIYDSSAADQGVIWKSWTDTTVSVKGTKMMMRKMM